MTRLYRNIPDEQEELIAALTERYSPRRIRFDTGFVGQVPVQCSGRIGRRFFYFRFRGDSASLTIGSADNRRAASRTKAARRKSLRQLRRGVGDDWFGSFMVKQDLKRNDVLDRHPSNAVWYAVANDVTGERYAGDLEPEECTELFIELMDQLVLVPRDRRSPEFKSLRRGSSSWPMNHTQGIIRKPSKPRR